MTKVILLERIERLGQIGDEVTVKAGHARNYLVPQGKALRATAENRAFFEKRRTVWEAQQLKKRSEAEKIAEKLQGDKVLTISRPASETGRLYGSIPLQTFLEEIEKQLDVRLGKNQLLLRRPVKEVGTHPLQVKLHPEVAFQLDAQVTRLET